MRPACTDHSKSSRQRPQPCLQSHALGYAEVRILLPLRGVFHNPLAMACAKREPINPKDEAGDASPWRISKHPGHGLLCSEEAHQSKNEEGDLCVCVLAPARARAFVHVCKCTRMQTGKEKVADMARGCLSSIRPCSIMHLRTYWFHTSGR